MMAWLGADVIKVELPGRGDITRSQLRDVPNADSPVLHHAELQQAQPHAQYEDAGGQALLEDLVQRCDVLVENFGPGVLDRAGFDWDRLQTLNPRLIYASIKGFGPGPFADCKAYENVARCMGGSASTTGTADGAPTVTGAQIGDSGTGIHCVVGILAALLQREHSGRGQRGGSGDAATPCSTCAGSSCATSSTRPRGRCAEYPDQEFDDFACAAGNASGRRPARRALRCAPGGANDYAST
ncbi:CoA transferase [Cupriavidus basilensis]